jgi:hypothetical protein
MTASPKPDHVDNIETSALPHVKFTCWLQARESAGMPAHPSEVLINKISYTEIENTAWNERLHQLL